MSPSKQTLPRSDELEVSLFGPGLGESVVLHLGAGEWMVVDSCSAGRDGAPVALQYLDELGVDVGVQVKIVAASHWHDDHTRGLARVLEAAKAARFHCSSALRSREFLTVVAEQSDLFLVGNRGGLTEFAEVLRILQTRAPTGVRKTSVGPEWTGAQQVLYSRLETPHVPACRVLALSPSAASQTRGLQDMATLLPRAGAPKRAAVAQSPNDTCMVLWIEVGAARVLLGADLEVGSNDAVGWRAVLARRGDTRGLAHIYKVSHHGSANADTDGIWNMLVSGDEPASILTPFRSGRGLPTSTDVERLKARPGSAYVTADPRKRSGTTLSAVRRTIKEMGATVTPVIGPMGHVRCRMSLQNLEVNVELFGPARAA